MGRRPVAFQLGDVLGLLVRPLAHIAQIVRRQRVLWIEDLRLAIRENRVLEEPELAIGVADVDEELGVALIELQRPLEDLQRLLLHAKLAVEVAKIDVRLDQRWV